MWLANVVSTAILVGLIWTMQFVHYPLFAAVPEPAFRAYHAAHVSRITALVAPLMVLEASLAVAWWVRAWRAGDDMRVVSIAAALVALAWISTGLLSVPLHDRLAQHPDPVVVAALVRTNLVRAVAWTLRLGLVVVWGAPR